MSLYDDVEREARHDWLNERAPIDPLWAVDGELDDMSPEERDDAVGCPEQDKAR